MDHSGYTYEQSYVEQKDSLPRGVLGAVLGAIIGAVLWCVVAVVTEYIHSVIGFLIGLLVGFGYDLFKGRQGTARMVVIFVCVILAVVLGTLAAHVWWVHDLYLDEKDFVTTATKEELAEAYFTPEELAELNSYPEPLKKLALDSLEITVPSEEEYFRLYLEDPEFTKGVGSECLTSIFFGLLGSAALIVKNGGKKKNTPDKPVNFDEANADSDSASERDPNSIEETPA